MLSLLSLLSWKLHSIELRYSYFQCLFSVYRLAVDAKPVGLWCCRLKISELAQGFSDGCAIQVSWETCIKRKGLLWFLSIRSGTYHADAMSKEFILAFVSPYCNKKHKRWISVFVIHIKSVKIFVNLWEPSNQGLLTYCKVTEFWTVIVGLWRFRDEKKRYSM